MIKKLLKLLAMNVVIVCLWTWFEYEIPDSSAIRVVDFCMGVLWTLSIWSSARSAR